MLFFGYYWKTIGRNKATTALYFKICVCKAPKMEVNKMRAKSTSSMLKILALLLAIVMCFSACGSGEDASTNQDAANASANDDATQEVESSADESEQATNDDSSKEQTNDTWNRRDSPEIDPHKYGQLIVDKGAKAIQWSTGFQ